MLGRGYLCRGLTKSHERSFLFVLLLHTIGVTYPGTGALDALLDFDQLTLARSRGAAFGGFSEARVTFEPTYKYDKVRRRKGQGVKKRERHGSRSKPVRKRGRALKLDTAVRGPVP